MKLSIVLFLIAIIQYYGIVLAYPALTFESHSDMFARVNNPSIPNTNKAEIKQWLVDQNLYTAQQVDDERQAMIDYTLATYGIPLSVDPPEVFFDASYEGPGISVTATRFNDTHPPFTVRQLKVNDVQLPDFLLDRTREHGFGWIIRNNATWEDPELGVILPAGQIMIYARLEFITDHIILGEKRTTFTMQTRPDTVLNKIQRSLVNGIAIHNAQLVYTDYPNLNLEPVCDFYGLAEQTFQTKQANATHPAEYLQRTVQTVRCPGEGNPNLV